MLSSHWPAPLSLHVAVSSAMLRGAGLCGNSCTPLGRRAKHIRTGSTEINSSLHWLGPAGPQQPDILICSSPLRPPETQQGQRNMLTQPITCAVLIFHIRTGHWEFLGALPMKRYDLNYCTAFVFSLVGHQTPLAQVTSHNIIWEFVEHYII